MKLKLTRKHLFLISLVVVFLSILMFRIDYLIEGKTTTGEVIKIKTWATGSRRFGGTYSAPVVTFNSDQYTITFQGETNMSATIGEKVNVIYQPNNSEKVLIYSFIGFWLTPILWHIIPYILLIGPAIFSFVKKNDQIIIVLERKPKLFKIKGRSGGDEGSKKINTTDNAV